MARLSGEAILAQRVVILSSLAIVPLLFLPAAVDPFVPPKWLAIKLAALLLLVLSLLRRGEARPRLLAAPADLCALLLLTAFTIASFRTPGTWTGLETPARILSLWVLCRVVARGDLWGHLAHLHKMGFGVATILSVVAVVLVASGVKESSSALRWALLGHGNYAGQWSVLVMPVLAAFFLTARSRAGRVLTGLSLGLFCCYMLVSRCRGAWLALLIAIAAFAFFAGVKRLLKPLPWRRLLVIGLIMVVSVLIMWQTGLVRDRLLTALDRADTGAKFRLLAWESSLRMVADESVWGVGSDAFAAYYPRYRSSREGSLFPQRRFVRNPHDSYVRAAAEAGPLGMVAILFLALTALRLAVRAWRGPLEGREGLFRAAMGVGVVATLAHSSVSFNLESPVSALYFWVFLGLLSQATESRRRPAPVSGGRRAARVCVVAAAAVFLALTTFVDTKMIVASIDAAEGARLKLSGNLSKAGEKLSSAVRLWPESPDYHHSLGKVMIQLGDYRACEEHNREAIIFWPYFRDALLDLGTALAEQGRGEEAMVFVSRSLEVDPSFADARIALGNLYRMKGEYPEAIEQYRLASQRRVMGEKAYYYIAGVLASQGKMQEARKAAEYALSGRWCLDNRLRFAISADELMDYLVPGDKPFIVVARDCDLWPLWESKTHGMGRINTSPLRVEIPAQADGVESIVSPDGEVVEFHFKEVPGACVYSLVVDNAGEEKSFDLMARAEFQSRLLTLYGRILHSLSESDRAREIWRAAVRLDPDNSEARACLSSTE